MIHVMSMCPVPPAAQITRWFVAGAIVVYALYAIWVFCGDEWHARGRPSMSWPELQDLLLQRWGREKVM